MEHGIYSQHWRADWDGDWDGGVESRPGWRGLLEWSPAGTGEAMLFWRVTHVTLEKLLRPSEELFCGSEETTERTNSSGGLTCEVGESFKTTIIGVTF